MSIVVTVARQGETASRAEIRTHALVMDRPREKGGSDKGPMGGEALLAALGGCFMSNLMAAAAARNVDLGTVSLEICGNLAEAGASRFDCVRLVVLSGVGQDLQALGHVVTVAERGCVVANTLKAALTLHVEIK